MKKFIFFVVVALSLMGIAIFLWWTISPLFITTEVNDELSPEFLETLAKPITPTEIPSDLEEDTPEIINTKQATSSSLTDLSIENTPVETATPPKETGQPIATEGSFVIQDTRGHPATGAIRTIQTEDTSLVRYENYDGTNGPDLYVYLAKDLDANEFVSLGQAKGNKGNINYTVPDDIDINEYKYVLTWCKAFGVLFDYAEIQ